MGRALWLGVLASLFAITWWLARPAPRAPLASAPLVAEEPHAERTETELLQPEQFAQESLASSTAEASPGDPSDGARRTRLAADRPVQPPKRAVVRGRLFVAETGDPIEASMAVFLRTIDLGQKEHLVTRSDGTFTSREVHLRGVLLARVRDGDNRELVDHEGLFDPALAEEWPVWVPMRSYPTLVRGRVVDRRGEPLEDVRVQLVPLGPELPYVERQTDHRGQFELQGLRAGVFRLHLQGLWVRSEPRELELRAGTNELGELVLAEPHAAELLVRFLTPEGSDFPQALLVLHPSCSAQTVPFYDYLAEELGGGVYELRLARLPAGECTLEVESLDGRTYEPERRVFSVPAEIEIKVGGVPHEGQRLRVHDAQSGEPILNFELWARTRGSWSTAGTSRGHELYLRGADAWVLMAENHRALRGTNDPSAGGVVEVALEGGWSELFVFEDIEGDSFGNQDIGTRRTLLEGVAVFAGGELAGRSDADGQALLEREEEPASIEFRLPGWRVVREVHHVVGLRLVSLAQSP